MNEPTKDKYGQYSVLQIRDHNRVTEHCNVGVVVFDENGENYGYKADTSARAIRMGVLHGPWAEEPNGLTILDFEHRLKGMRNMEQLKKTLGSMGHAMSIIGFREPYPTLIRPNVVESLFETFVLGRDPSKPFKDAQRDG